MGVKGDANHRLDRLVDDRAVGFYPSMVSSFSIRGLPSIARIAAAAERCREAMTNKAAASISTATTAEILGLSLVTNLAAGMSETPLDGDHVIAVATEAAPRIADLLQRVSKRF